MEEKKNRIEEIITYMLVIIYSVGIAGHFISSLRNLMLLLTPFVLILSAVLVMVPVSKSKNQKFYFWFGAVFLFTIILEIAGVKTGQIFGHYNYGSVLGIKLFGVPVIIGLNWVLVLAGTILVTEKTTFPVIIKIIIAGILATAFDILLEPVAVKLGYWNWQDNYIPLQNYLAWFFIASFSSSLFYMMKLKIVSKLFERLYFIQFVFFFFLNFIEQGT